MRLTKRKALEICRDLWDWLADTGETWKEDWPGWLIIRGGFSNYCPCCEYAEQHDSEGIINCRKCPLVSLWGGHRGACEAGAYGHWTDARYGKNKKRQKALARRIATACRAELAKMDTKKVRRDR